MGFWDYLQLAMARLKRRSPGPDYSKDACQTSGDTLASPTGTIGVAGVEAARHSLQSAAAGAGRLATDAYRSAQTYASQAAGEADRAARWIAERVPEPEQREQMLRVLKEVGITAADVAISESVRCVPGGPPLYRSIKKGVAEIAKIQGEAVAEKASSSPPEADGGTEVAAAEGGLRSQRLPAAPGGTSAVRRSRM